MEMLQLNLVAWKNDVHTDGLTFTCPSIGQITGFRQLPIIRKYFCFWIKFIQRTVAAEKLFYEDIRLAAIA